MSELALKLIAENKAKRERGEDATYLDLGNCGLTELPDLSGMDWLETLIVSNEWWDGDQREWIKSQNTGPNNRIARPPAHPLPDSLRKVVFGGKWDDRWPISNGRFLEKLTGLTSLYLSSNQISDWSFLEKLTGLTTLDLMWNQISDGRFLGNLTGLTTLDLSHNKISDGHFLEKLTGLTSLDLSFNQISDGRFLEKLTGLTTLNLSSNKISEWSFLEKLTGLTSLDLSLNKISDLRFLEKLSGLTSLDLRHNKISDIRFLEKLSGLTSLDLGFNKISDLRFLEKLTGLTSLKLYWNQISDLRFLGKLSGLTSLNLGWNQISDLRALVKLSGLTSLDLSNNRISDLRFLEKLSSLTSLDLRSNQISDIRFLEKLSSLTSLNLSSNQISDISFLEKHTGLTSLDLANNIISDIRFLEKLTGLTSLNLYSNQISDISSLEKLTALMVLYLSKNQISDISSLEKLTALNKIGLNKNQLTDLTTLWFFIKEKGLRVVWKEGYLLSPGEVNMEGNPLTTPPLEIVQYGNSAILNYFSERSKTQFQNTEIKLIFIGNSTAGKTSLSRYLREGVFEHGQPNTHGIQNYRWEPEGRELQVNIWDFGGQEYYHATHRLFLSRNAVYALIWDGKTDRGGIEPTDIYYEDDSQPYTVPLEHFPKTWWLKNIHFNLNKYARHEREGDVPIPVLLLQNKCAAGEEYEMEDVPNEFGHAPFHLPAKWRNHHIDLAAAAQGQADGEQGEWTMRFNLFETELLKTLESQMAHYEFAVYHRDIRDRVRELASGDDPVNEMSWSAFEEMCRDIEPDAKMDLVQIYLRDITGDILYFDQNERLRHRVFLRPDWVCNRIYTILSRKVLEREGFFDMVWVQEALQCEESEALDFVELMREFQLVFAENDETGAPTGNYVAPQYLPDNCNNIGELEGAKKYANLTHGFTLWFPDFLPKSHIARFVAHWGSNAKDRLFWKNGLLFQTAGCTALVERSEELKIRVDIQQGDTAKRAAAMQRIFQSLLDLEDGQAGFAVSLNAQDFVWWPNAQEAIYTRARQVKTFPPETAKYTDIQPFIIFQKPVTMAKKVFISYSHRDEDAMKELDKFLGPLERKGDIEIWTDRNILPGQNWKDEIMGAINSADLTLLLVSANFLDSNFINDEEIPRAFQRRESEGKHVVPIILNYCLWDITDIGNLQAIPKDGRPIADYPNAAQGWSEVARALMDLLK
jgi:internalin A